MVGVGGRLNESVATLEPVHNPGVRILDRHLRVAKKLGFLGTTAGRE